MNCDQRIKRLEDQVKYYRGERNRYKKMFEEIKQVILEKYCHFNEHKSEIRGDANKALYNGIRLFEYEYLLGTMTDIEDEANETI